MSDDTETTDRISRGLQMLDQVYGPGGSAPLAAAIDSPFVKESVENLFGEVWKRPHLSVRERRLLVIGATAMLGRADLIETQIKGALVNGEFTDAQLEEMVLQLAFYTGWGNATAMYHGIQSARKKFRESNAT